MEILSLGEKIKRRRKELNMTLKDLAGDRITPGQISLVESGKSNPSMDLLEYLANELKTSVEYLMESEETQAEKICVFYENIAESSSLNDDLNSAESYVEKALYYAEKYNLEYRKAKNLFLRGTIYYIKGEAGLAQQLFLSANTLFIRNNAYEEIINTFIKLGNIALNLNAYHSACSYFQQAEKVYIDNDIGNDFLIGQIFYYIAYTQYKLENINKAINYSFLAKEKYRQLDNKQEYAKTLLLLSIQYKKKGEIDNAIKYSKIALQSFKEISNIFYIGEIENNLGKLFSEFENIEESFEHLNKAKEIRERIKDERLMDTLITLCENYIKIKDISKCKEILESLLDISNNGNAKALVYYYLLKFRLDKLESNTNEAENTLQMALTYAKSMEYYKEAAEICIMIGKFYMDNGKEELAANYLNEGVELFRQVGILDNF